MLTTGILVLLCCVLVQLADGQCTHGDIRLEGGRNIFEGRVEVCANGMWGTVCDDLWDRDDAKVVCRQLGFPTIATDTYAFSRATFGEGSGPIHLDDMECDGDESLLIDCDFDSHNCGHHEDAGVACAKFLPGPHIVSATSSDTTVTISWRPSEQESTEAFERILFIAECFQNSSITSSNTVPVTDNTTYSVQVDDLFPSTSYECCVSAVYVYRRMINSGRFTSSVSCVSTVTNPAEDKLTTIPTTATTESTTTLIETEDAIKTTTLDFPTVVKTTLFPPTTQKDSVTNTIANKVQSSAVTGGVLGVIIAVLVAMVIVMGVALGYLYVFKLRRAVKSKPRIIQADPPLCNPIYDSGAQRMNLHANNQPAKDNDDVTAPQEMGDSDHIYIIH